MNRYVWLCWCLMMVLGPVAWADRGWTVVGQERAGSESKSFSVNQPVSKVAIACIEGQIIVQSVTVVDGDRRTPFQVANKIKSGETQQVSVGDKIQVGRLMVQVEGQGRYEVRVRR